ncbi:late embryogenesis abundant protein At1g64065-like [Quercus robur]|uniref:late embryogenesis abundant protein At1g64065-like n=1 Tax=Quercus robur TaxID=38942 RepID=UPI0021626A56|nr:late embryogenesis abundant protein At1g64065-like [Quercus robur]
MKQEPKAWVNYLKEPKEFGLKPSNHLIAIGPKLNRNTLYIKALSLEWTAILWLNWLTCSTWSIQSLYIVKEPRSDEEFGSKTSVEELKRKKRINLIIYIAAFVVFQTIVILVFALIVMPVKITKVWLGNNVKFHNVTTSNSTSPSFDINFTTQLRVYNTNFGPYKYDSTIATFMYKGVSVGQVTIPKGKAGLRSTKKVGVTVNVNSKDLPTSANLAGDLDSGLLMLNNHSKLSGKVELMFIMKKKKSVEMNCTMTINLSSKEIHSMICD